MKSYSAHRCRTLFWAFGLTALVGTTQWLEAQLPSGESGTDITSGAVTVSRAGNLMTINQNGVDRAIINWDDFSIATGNVTRFFQPGAESAILNRVTGATMSAIDGSLTANGNVFLVNPNGVVIGPTGVINTNGFVASTLGVTDADFLDGGDMTFSGTSTANLVNQGVITGVGGDVFLFGRSVTNEATGTVSAPNGTVGLAAGSTVRLAEAGRERVFVDAVTPGEATVDNKGLIQAAAVELVAYNGNAFGMAVKSDGTIEARATALVVDGGTVRLVAGKGNIDVQGTVSARKTGDAGGAIQVQGAVDGTVAIGGTLDAASEPAVVGASAVGGTIEVSGEKITLATGSLLDVSGSAGGGTIGVGAGPAWEVPPTATARQTTVEPGAELRANAVNSGNGGSVAVWSSETSTFSGAINAQALGATGDGGRAIVGTDGRIFLDGFTNLGSVSGKVGELTIASPNIEINASPTPPTPVLESISDAWVNQQLTMANLSFNMSEEIRLDNNANINWANDNDLSFTATDRVIGWFATIDSQGGGDLLLAGNADGSSTLSKSGVELYWSSLNASNGGDITLIAGGTKAGVTGLYMDGTTIDGGPGDVRIFTDEIELESPRADAIDGTGTLMVAPLTAGTEVRLGGTGDTAITTLDLNDTELAQISANFATTIFGSGAAGNLTLAPEFSFTTSGDLELATANAFINNDSDGAGALDGVGGDYLIYSKGPSFNQTAGLGAGLAEQYESPFRTTAGFAGSGFLYSEAAPAGPGSGPGPGPAPAPARILIRTPILIQIRPRYRSQTDRERLRRERRRPHLHHPHRESLPHRLLIPSYRFGSGQAKRSRD